ncbi:hypothetical protein, partial [Rhodopirellula bahusiensis]|uniref:hypothetical protein n=1 Tax=Rhodopirellula bahusiensis TaxID=2014065 RepID=UPI00329A1E35
RLNYSPIRLGLEKTAKISGTSLLRQVGRSTSGSMNSSAPFKSDAITARHPYAAIVAQSLSINRLPFKTAKDGVSYIEISTSWLSVTILKILTLQYGFCVTGNSPLQIYSGSSAMSPIGGESEVCMDLFDKLPAHSTASSNSHANPTTT